MIERRRIITFTNLFPSAAMPQHGTFVQERMQRVVAGQDDLELTVVNPVPAVPRLLARGERALLRRLPACETVAGVTVHHPRYFHLPGLSLGKQAERIARASLPVVRELARSRRCVLDAHYVYPDGVAAVRIGDELQIPCLVTARGSDVNVVAAQRVVRPQVQWAMPRAHALLAVSEALRQRFAAVAAVPPERIEVVRNGVDPERFSPGDRAAARRQLGLPPDRPLLLGVGRLVAAKGFHLAAAALPHLPAAVHLVLVGDGPARAGIVRAAPSGRLHLLGGRSRADVALAMQACDVLVLPSAREGWPNVVTEALASGLPVVATAVGGVPELLAEAVAGELVPAESGALAAALARQLQRGDQRAAIAAYAQRFSWEAPVARLRAVLRAA
jgi:glycosyltransferase involved in cell wall biosynthesis